MVGVHDQPHATSLAGSIFSGAMLSEMAPLVATARHLVLVVIAHFGWLILLLVAIDGDI